MAEPKDVEVVCKKCSSKSKASEFKVDPILGIMVCRKCYGIKAPIAKKEPTKEAKPVGWDKDDEVIRHLYNEKERSRLKLLNENREIKFEIIPGTRSLFYVCEGCEYKFKYNSIKHWPNTCPSCDKMVPKELYRSI